jgi:hypothetical protein
MPQPLLNPYRASSIDSISAIPRPSGQPKEVANKMDENGNTWGKPSSGHLEDNESTSIPVEM